MKSKIALITLLVFVLSFALMTINAQDKTKKDGKTVFVESKCVTCHTINIFDLKPEKKPKLKETPPDLSYIGDEFKADFIMKWVTKKVKLHGEKHPFKYEGTDEDLTILANWLESLKKPKK